MQALQQGELFGHDKRRVVGQHDAAGPDVDAFGNGGEMRNQHGWRGAGDAGHVVVLGHPEALEAQPIRGTGKGGRGLQCLAAGLAVVDHCQVEDRKGNLVRIRHVLHRTAQSAIWVQL